MLLLVHVIPGAHRFEVVGLHDGALRVRVAARAVEGEANRALLRGLADRLGIAPRQCELRRGLTARRKQLLIRGLDGAQVQRLLGTG